MAGAESVAYEGICPIQICANMNGASVPAGSERFARVRHVRSVEPLLRKHDSRQPLDGGADR